MNYNSEQLEIVHPHPRLLDYYFYLIRKYHMYGQRLNVDKLKKLIKQEKERLDVIVDICSTLYESKFRNEFKLIDKYTISNLKAIVKGIPNNAVVIVPGESPFRVVILLQMLYGKGNHLFKIDDSSVKNIRFIDFPISGIPSKLLSSKGGQISFTESN